MRITYWIVNIAFVFVFACFLFSAAYLINGSLEMFPTEEQQEKARLTAVCLMILFGIIEVMLIKARGILKGKL